MTLRRIVTFCFCAPFKYSNSLTHLLSELLLLLLLHLSMFLSQFILRLHHHRRELVLRDLRTLFTQLQTTSNHCGDLLRLALPGQQSGRCPGLCVQAVGGGLGGRRLQLVTRAHLIEVA